MRAMLPRLVAAALLTGCAHQAERLARCTVPPLPTARHGHRVHLVGNELVMLGGFEDGSRADDRGAAETWRVDVETGGWKRAADMARPRSFFGSVVVDDDVFAIGGGIDRYRMREDRWETVAPAGFPVSHFGAAAVGSKVYVLGGYPACGGGCIGFDVATGQTFDPPEPPGFKVNDHFHVVVTLAGELHVFGGLQSSTFEPLREHWVLREGEWRAAAPSPRPVWAKFSIVQVVGDEVFIFEGREGLRYDARADRWENVAGTEGVLVMPASFERGGCIYVVGGMEVEGGKDAGIRQYLTAENRWLPKGR